MNERIKELEKQAYTEVMHERGGTYMAFDREKFAELIVDEVYDYILNATFDDEPWPERAEVKKHFGVEE